MTQRAVYERLWKQQKALQVLQAARELLQQFPNSTYLVELVQRLQHELNAWGELRLCSTLVLRHLIRSGSAHARTI
jgi:hypothetical protein